MNYPSRWPILTRMVPVNNKKDQKAHNVTSGATTWKDTQRNTRKGILSWHTSLQHNFTTWLHPVETIISKYDFDTVGDFADVCTQIALKCLYHARLGRPDILWAGNLLARGVHMEQGMRQNINQTKQLHGLHPQAQILLPCRKQSDWMWMGSTSGRRLRWWVVRLKNQHPMDCGEYWWSNICADFVAMPKANCCVTKRYWSWNHFLRRML